MTTRKEDKPLVAGPHMDEVSEETRAYAANWLKRLRNDCKAQGLPFHEPSRVENYLGEVVYEWGNSKLKRKLSVYIEDQQATYLRMWGWDERGRGGPMEEGECDWIDHSRLLWYWFISLPLPDEREK